MKRRSLSKKFLYTTVIISASLVAVIYIIFSSYFINQQKEQYNINWQNTCNLAAENLVQKISELDIIALQLGNNINIKNYYAQLYFDQDKSNFFDTDSLTKSHMYKVILPYLVRMYSADRICIYNKNGNFLPVGDILEREAFQSYLDKDRLKDIDDEFEETGNKSLLRLFSENGKDYISIIRRVSDIDVLHGQPLGYVEIQLEVNKINKDLKIINNENEALKYYYYDKCFYSDNDNNIEYTNQFTSESNDGLSVKLFVNNKQYVSVILSMAVALFITFILVVLFLYRVQRYYISQITKPIMSVCSRIEKAGTITITNENTGSDINELEELDKLVNLMLVSLKNNVNNVVDARMGELHAQIMALQAQINPHFIHNTLAVIASMPAAGMEDDVYDLCMSLSTLISYSADYTQTTVYMNDELEHIRNYLEIINARYEGNFSFDVSDSNELGNIRVPKFILQPIVENAIEHSLKKTEFPWHISVVFKKDTDKWFVDISDNGAGIEQEAIDLLKSTTEKLKSESIEDILHRLKIGGFSLVNVMTRMLLTYRDDFIFDAFVNEAKGTTIRIGGNINNDKGFSS